MVPFKFSLLILALPALLLQGIQGESFLRGEPDSNIQRELAEMWTEEKGYGESLGQCTGATCGTYGDPHVITCDGLVYDCQATGMVTFMKNQMYNIQARLVSVGQETMETFNLIKASLINDVAIGFLQKDASGNSAPVLQFGSGNLENRANGKFPSEVGCTEYRHYHPMHMTGEPGTVEPNPMACRKRCESTAGCTKFSYWANGKCHINNDDQTETETPANWNRSVSGTLTSTCGKPPQEMEIKEEEQRLKHGRIGENCPLLFFVDGVMVDISGIDRDGYLYGDQDSDVNVKMENGRKIKVVYKLETNDYAEVHLIAHGGVEHMWSCHWEFFVCLPESQQEQFKSNSVGLFGTPDGNKENEFMDVHGDQLSFSNQDYCLDNWCVSQKESIMAYPGELTYDDMKCAHESYKVFDIDDPQCVLSANVIKDTCKDAPPLLVHACELDCCLGGCDEMLVTLEEIEPVFPIIFVPSTVSPTDSPRPCTDDHLVKTSDTLCPASDIPTVQLIGTTGAQDLPDGADVFYHIQVDQGDDRIERTVKFKINNPFDTSADVFVKYDKRVLDSSFMDPHCNTINDLDCGCQGFSPEFEVACHEYDGVNPFAIVKVYFASSDLPFLDTSSVNKCCNPGPYDTSVGVVAYTFEIQCHCETSARSARSLTADEFRGLQHGMIPAQFEQIDSIYLKNNGFTGTIPHEIGLMTTLTHLELSDNKLTGEIISEIGLLTSLTFLELSENELVGTLSTKIGLLTSLTHLDLAHNDFVGTIPTEIGMLTGLTNLELNSNDLTGTIPTELGLLTSLTHLELDNNKLVGTIPNELGLMGKLSKLELDDNNLTGTIPTEIGMLTSVNIVELDHNKLIGTLPTELGLMKQMIEFDVKDNHLTGTIPTEIGMLTSLKEFQLSDNLFTGDLPVEVESLQLWD